MPLAVNATSPLTTPTYDGSGQVVHPSVVDATEITGNTWNGYRYWMGMTPYPNSDVDLENPSILASNDKVSWVVPPGLTNPVVSRPSDPVRYNSDTDLLLEPDGSQLHMFYRESGDNSTGSDNEERIFVVSSSDGSTWSAPSLLFGTGVSNDIELFLSPSSVKAGGIYHLYGVRASGRGIAYKTAPNVSGPWSATQILEPGEYAGLEPWHMACRLEHNGALRFTMHVSPGGRAQNGEIWAAESPGPGRSLKSVAQLLVETNSWDDQLYRGCMIPLSTLGSYGLYYSARNGGTWRVGYTEFSGPVPLYVDVEQNTETTVADVKTNEIYEVRVQAENDGGPGPFSAWQAISPNDTGSPFVSSVTATTAGTYATGDTLSFTVNWSETVTVTGTPAINLDIGGSARQANYASGSGTAATAFTYTVQSGDLDTDGVTVTSLTLDGGTIKDSAGNNATLTLSAVGDTSGVLVDGVVDLGDWPFGKNIQPIAGQTWVYGPRHPKTGMRVRLYK